MKHKFKIGDNLVYGDWSDTYENQFIVNFHPAGQSCDVIILGGMDYGGGIVSYAENVRADTVNRILESHTDPYELYRAMQKLVNNCGTMV